MFWLGDCYIERKEKGLNVIIFHISRNRFIRDRFNNVQFAWLIYFFELFKSAKRVHIILRE